MYCHRVDFQPAMPDIAHLIPREPHGVANGLPKRQPCDVTDHGIETIAVLAILGNAAFVLREQDPHGRGGEPHDLDQGFFS